MPDMLMCLLKFVRKGPRRGCRQAAITIHSGIERRERKCFVSGRAQKFAGRCPRVCSTNSQGMFRPNNSADLHTKEIVTTTTLRGVKINLLVVQLL